MWILLNKMPTDNWWQSHAYLVAFYASAQAYLVLFHFFCLCLFDSILCFCLSLFGPVLFFSLLLLWSRFMRDFSALFLPHGRQYIPISPAQELGHLSLQLNRTTAILHYFKRMIIFFSSGAVLFWSLLFQKVNIRKSHLLSLSLIRESRLSILYIVVALMDNLGSQVKAHLLPEPNHSIIGYELIIVSLKKNTYKCINV